MNAFNDVFLAIKEHSGTSNGKSDEVCVSKIALTANLPADKLGFYLDFLKELGLIKYSKSDNLVRLTAFGRKQERLFA